MSQEKDLNLSKDQTSYYKLIIQGEIENISRKTATNFQDLLSELSSKHRINFECSSYSKLDGKGIGNKILTYRIETRNNLEQHPKVEIGEKPEKELDETSKITSSSLESLYLEVYRTMCEVEQKINDFLDEEGKKRQYLNSKAVKLIILLQNPFYAIPIILILTIIIVLVVFKK